MKKLILEDIHVESFATSEEAEEAGTVRAHSAAACQTIYSCDPLDLSCQYGTCWVPVCTYSLGDPSCDQTCDNNYGCGTVDPRCTYGGVYIC